MACVWINAVAGFGIGLWRKMRSFRHIEAFEHVSLCSATPHWCICDVVYACTLSHVQREMMHAYLGRQHSPELNAELVAHLS